DACAKARQSRNPVPKERQGERSKAQGELVYTDVWGPAKVKTPSGMRYFITFTDDHTRETHTYLMRNKSEALSRYVEYEAWVKTQRNAMIKALQPDNGGEYPSHEFEMHTKRQGTVQRFTVHDTPQQNGVAERLNRTLVEHANAMRMAAAMPKT